MSATQRKERARAAARARWNRATARELHHMLHRLMTVYPQTAKQQATLAAVHRILARAAARHTENQHA
jgi:hypothetical protein